MKFITIALLILLINVSASIINAVDATAGTLYFTDTINPYEEPYSDLGAKAVQGDSYFQNSATQDTSTSFGFGDFAVGFAKFVGIFLWGIVAVPYTLQQFGLPLFIASFVSIPVYLSYLLALAQFISNRATKGMT